MLVFSSEVALKMSLRLERIDLTASTEDALMSCKFGKTSKEDAFSSGGYFTRILDDPSMPFKFCKTIKMHSKLSDQSHDTSLSIKSSSLENWSPEIQVSYRLRVQEKKK